ncbi:anti-sigma factor family protein [Yinghuangia soli]|uniref:Zf-HC2 domain-containing protein n=1 Tax=Yinghuangia soli TaxID=2908204 RepID=A0AA41PWX9_9ACTN|nr:zf-HC2 domain-containing protein [Yinghuangia soli]MCF2526865.1 zf-HC2 domain-containing protein [Yinghuangia soli]
MAVPDAEPPAAPALPDPRQAGSPTAKPDDPGKQVCAALRLDLGAYVLGTLDETETHWIRAHVAVCPECRAEYEELAVLPAFLARLTPAEAEAGAVRTEVPPAALFAEAAERARRARRQRVVLLGAAAASAVLLGTLGWVLGSDDTGTARSALPTTGPPTASAPAVPAPASPTARPGERTLKATDPQTDTSMTLAYRPVSWGTAVEMRLSGVPAGTRCQLDVYGTRGRQETASSWVVPDGGYDGETSLSVPGGTSIPPDEITKVEVSQVGSGRVLLTATPGQSGTKSP